MQFVNIYTDENSNPKKIMRGQILSYKKEDDSLFIQTKEGEHDLIFPYDSLQIAWMELPPDPYFLKSVIPRPDFTESVGYQVEVKSSDKWAEKDDAYTGEIISINKFNFYSII